MDKLLKVKAQKKAKNPTFKKQDSYKKKRLSDSWRKPRGWDSKLRKRMQRQAIVEPGYGTPVAVKGKDSTGLTIMNVVTSKDVEQLSQKEHSAVVSGKLGLKKRLILIAELIKKKIKILNIRNPEDFLKAKQTEKQAEMKKKEEKKEEKKAPAKKETESKESVDDKLSDEEKKKLEKKEIDKLLTKRE